MKKVLFMAALTAAALSSCSNEELVNQAAQAPAEDGAVRFSAYTARQTRAGVVNLTQLKKSEANGGGFGVFAYDQGKKDFATYSASSTQPNFMYNQGVFYGSDWEYSPVKYYNNNDGAMHSFFAYAPYNKSVKAVFSSGKAPQIRYTAAEDIDLLWGEAWGSKNVDAEKPGVTSKIGFNFKHALSKVTVKAIPFIDAVHGTSTDPTDHSEHTTVGTLAKGTKITLRSVKFEGSSMPSKGLLNLGDGTWTIEETDENAYEMATSLDWDATSSALTLDETNDRQVVMENKMIIPTEDKKFKIKVVYDVTTVDTDNPKNNSTITNTIESKDEFSLVAGTAYEFHLDLGLTSVKFDATVVDWNDPVTDIDVDLPNNLPYTLIGATSSLKALKTKSATAIASTDFTAVGDIVIANDNKAYECTKAAVAGPPAKEAEFKEVDYSYIYDSTNKKLYVYNADHEYDEESVDDSTLSALSKITSSTSAGYYLIGSDIYYVEWQ